MAEEIQGLQPPTVLETTLSQIGSLSSDQEQQQQQQQQQNCNQLKRRFLNLETNLPEEEVITKLTTEIAQTNAITPRSAKRLIQKHDD